MSLLGKGLFYTQKALQNGHCKLFGVTRNGTKIFRHKDYPEYIFVRDGKPVKRIIQVGTTNVEDFANNQLTMLISRRGAIEKDVVLDGAKVAMAPARGTIDMISKSDGVTLFLPYKDETKINAFIANCKPELQKSLTSLYQQFIDMAKVHGKLS